MPTGENDSQNIKNSPDLRSRAEEVLASQGRMLETMSTTDISSLIHELHVHQIELEMQNEELVRSRSQAEEERRKYLHLWERSPVGCLILDPNWRVSEVNIAGRMLLGRTAEHLQKQRFVPLLRPEDQIPMHLMLERATESGIAEKREVGIVQPDGTERTCFLVCHAPESAPGMNPVLVTLTDITSRKEAEAALLRSKERLRLALETGRVGLWDRNMVTDEIEWSPELYELLGRDPNGPQITGETFFEYIHPDDLPQVRENVDAWLKTDGLFQDEFRVVREDGKMRWLASVGRADRNEAGEVVRLIGINYDTTEHKQREVELMQAKAAAEEANLAKDRFLANMSHELRTPLSGIMGLADVLVDLLQKPENLYYIHLIKESAQSLNELLTEILDSAKIESGGVLISDRPFNVRREINKVINLFQDRAKAAGNRILWNMDPTMPLFLSGDAERLEQILRNLVSNAVKFTRNGNIVVGTDCLHESSESVTVTFTVQDTGSGIPEEKQKHLFEDFFQVENPLTKEHAGTGLGLSIAKRLVDAMNGRVWAQSQEGQGSTFFVQIRFAVPREQIETAVEAASPTDLSEGRKLNVLAAEDNKINQLYIKKVLEKLGHRVTIAENGQLALEYLHETHFDVVLMDIQMPVMDGYTAIRRIRETDLFNRNIPIFALTAYASERDVEKALEAGADGHIAKPVDFDDLKRLLQKIADKTGVGESTLYEKWFPTHQDILDRYSKNPAYYIDLCQQIKTVIPERMEDITEALESGNIEGAARECHYLAGIGATIGDESLWRVGLENEARLLAAFNPTDHCGMEQMEKTTADTLRYLDELTARLAKIRATNPD